MSAKIIKIQESDLEKFFEIKRDIQNGEVKNQIPTSVTTVNTDTLTFCENILPVIEQEVIYSGLVAFIDGPSGKNIPFTLSFKQGDDSKLYLVAHSTAISPYEWLLVYNGIGDESISHWITCTEADSIYDELQVASLTTHLEARCLEFALRPNIMTDGAAYHWVDGSSDKRFTEKTLRYVKNFITVDDVNFKLFQKKLIRPMNSNSIKESETDYLTYDGKQMYFISLDDFDAGLTYVNPRISDPTIDDETLDMYVVRCLKTSDNDIRNLLSVNISTNDSDQYVTDILYTASTGNNYGYSILENIDDGVVKIYKKYKDVDYEDVLVKIQRNFEEAEADIQIMPEGSLGVIRGN